MSQTTGKLTRENISLSNKLVIFAENSSNQAPLAVQSIITQTDKSGNQIIVTVRIFSFATLLY
jgi:hypothetical protein